MLEARAGRRTRSTIIGFFFSVMRILTEKRLHGGAAEAVADRRAAADSVQALSQSIYEAARKSG